MASVQLDRNTCSDIVRISEKIVPSAVLPVPGQVTSATVLKCWASHKHAKILEYVYP